MFVVPAAVLTNAVVATALEGFVVAGIPKANPVVVPGIVCALFTAAMLNMGAVVLGETPLEIALAKALPTVSDLPTFNPNAFAKDALVGIFVVAPCTIEANNPLAVVDMSVGEELDIELGYAVVVPLLTVPNTGLKDRFVGVVETGVGPGFCIPDDMAGTALIVVFVPASSVDDGELTIPAPNNGSDEFWVEEVAELATIPKLMLTAGLLVVWPTVGLVTNRELTDWLGTLLVEVPVAEKSIKSIINIQTHKPQSYKTCNMLKWSMNSKTAKEN